MSISRLDADYGVKTSVDFLLHSVARWIDGSTQAIEQATWYSTSIHTRDGEDGLLVLFNTPLEADYVARNHPDLTFKALN